MRKAAAREIPDKEKCLTFDHLCHLEKTSAERAVR